MICFAIGFSNCTRAPILLQKDEVRYTSAFQYLDFATMKIDSIVPLVPKQASCSDTQCDSCYWNKLHTHFDYVDESDVPRTDKYSFIYSLNSPTVCIDNKMEKIVSQGLWIKGRDSCLHIGKYFTHGEYKGKALIAESYTAFRLHCGEQQNPSSANKERN
jgi:hypothetical protein